MRAVFPRMFPQADAAAAMASLEREFTEVAKKEGTMTTLAKEIMEWGTEYRRRGYEKGIRQGEIRGIRWGIAQGIAEGHEQAVELGLAAERELLCRLATRKFGAAAGNALSRHLADTSDRDRLAEIGERIVDSGAGAELLKWLDADRDDAWKRLISLPVLVQHLLEGFVSPIAERLDFSTLWQLPADSVKADARQRNGDAALRVNMNDGSARSLVLLLKFQSTIDPSMPARMRDYAAAARERLRRQTKMDPDGKIRVLPVVVYSGTFYWNALNCATEVCVTAGGEPSLGLTGDYLLLDVNRLVRKDLPRDNLVAAVFRLNAAKTLDELRARLRAMPRGLDDDVSRALIDWIRMVFPEMFPQSDTAGVTASLEREFPEIAKEEGTMMALAKRVQEWEEEYGRQGFEKGLAQGLAAERELICRMATRKFGATAGGALARNLAGISDSDRLAVIGERIIDCGTGAELLEWLDANRDGAGTG